MHETILAYVGSFTSLVVFCYCLWKVGIETWKADFSIGRMNYRIRSTNRLLDTLVYTVNNLPGRIMYVTSFLQCCDSNCISYFRYGHFV